MKYYLAIDIGASSGRHIIGYSNNDGSIIMEEIYRFKNDVKMENNHLIWDIEYLFDEVKNGIKIAIQKYKTIESMSIDTWGVDYCLLDKDNNLINPVYAYRDSRDNDVIDEVHNLINFEKLYNITGSQFQRFNTIYQLYWDKLNNRINDGTKYLMIPEYLMYRLTGKQVHEYTNASTTGLMDINTNYFSNEIIEKIGLDKSLFEMNLAKPGNELGNFSKEIQEELGGNIPVKLCATHDTASAVEALDEKVLSEDTVYLSSGTWSLLGVKLPKGINSKEARLANYSNEYGPSYIRFQKNIMGLWIIQGIQKKLNVDFTELVEMAEKSNTDLIFDVNDECFLSSLDIIEDIKKWFNDHDIDVTHFNINDYILSSYKSLAYSYKVAIEELEEITNRKYNNICIIGGGAKNELLNNLTEKYTKKKVIALPIEATSLGNIKSQMGKKL